MKKMIPTLDEVLSRYKLERSIYKDFRWCNPTDPTIWPLRKMQGWEPVVVDGEFIEANEMWLCERTLPPKQFLNVFLTGRREISEQQH